MKHLIAALTAGLVLTLGASPLTAEETLDGLPLVFEDDFENGADNWQPTDANAWKILKLDDGNHVYNQFQLSKYQPPHRSPHNMSLIKDLVVGDFILTAKVLSTNSKAGAHRDMDVFFQFQDPASFYYVHMGARPDPHSSQIMIVDDAPRLAITEDPEHDGVPWTDGWHNVKVVRKAEEGLIEIYFDDMKKPLMTAKDDTFTWGQVGLGSFDDHGYWDDVKVYGKKVEPKK